MVTVEDYQNYLEFFLEEGDKFNGSNIFLSNILEENCPIVFANNQPDTDHLQVINDDDIHSFGNGDLSDQWPKQKLLEDLVEHAFSVFRYVAQTNDIFLLKNLLFKAAECNRSHWDHESGTGRIKEYRNHENYEHSSIFLEKHMLHSGDVKREDLYATVSTTLVIQTDDHKLYYFERIYDHDKVREWSEEEHSISHLILNFNHERLIEQYCSHQTPTSLPPCASVRPLYGRSWLRCMPEGG